MNMQTIPGLANQDIHMLVMARILGIFYIAGFSNHIKQHPLQSTTLPVPCIVGRIEFGVTVFLWILTFALLNLSEI